MEIIKLALKDLHFDPENPRLPSSVRGNNETEVLDWMLTDGSLIELMGSISEQGYFEGEPVLVVKDGGGYKVIEGNRRLAAVKLLQNPKLATKRQSSIQQLCKDADFTPEELPCVVYESRDQILNYLGYRHITGIKAWGPLAKAQYLNQLRERIEEQDPKEQFQELAKLIGSRSDYVARLLTALALFNIIKSKDFFDIPGLDESKISFSFLSTALTYKDITQFLGLENSRDPDIPGIKIDKLKDLTSWMFEKNTEGKTRIGESRNLSDLNLVVGTNTALSAFVAGKPLKEAVLLTRAPTDLFRTAINNIISHLDIVRDTIHLVRDPQLIDAENLKSIGQMARDLFTIVISRLNKDEQE